MNCNELCKKELLYEHLDICPKVMIKCDYESCFVEFMREDKQYHEENECMISEVTCEKC